MDDLSGCHALFCITAGLYYPSLRAVLRAPVVFDTRQGMLPFALRFFYIFDCLYLWYFQVTFGGLGVMKDYRAQAVNGTDFVCFVPCA